MAVNQTARKLIQDLSYRATCDSYRSRGGILTQKTDGGPMGSTAFA